MEDEEWEKPWGTWCEERTSDGAEIEIDAEPLTPTRPPLRSSNVRSRRRIQGNRQRVARHYASMVDRAHRARYDFRFELTTGSMTRAEAVLEFSASSARY